MTISKDTKILEAILFASGSPVLEDDLKDKIKHPCSLIPFDTKKRTNDFSHKILKKIIKIFSTHLSVIG